MICWIKVFCRCEGYNCYVDFGVRVVCISYVIVCCVEFEGICCIGIIVDVVDWCIECVGCIVFGY